MAHIVNLDGDDENDVYGSTGGNDERRRHERASVRAPSTVSVPATTIAATTTHENLQSSAHRYRVVEPPSALTLPALSDPVCPPEAPVVSMDAPVVAPTPEIRDTEKKRKSSSCASSEMRFVCGGSADDVLSPVTPVTPMIAVSKEILADHENPDFDSSDAVSVKSVGQVKFKVAFDF